MSTHAPLYSSCFKIPEADYASVASRSGCSWAKPITHTGFGIPPVMHITSHAGLRKMFAR
ncbi:MAG: hypothetical protein LBJ00_10585 [Planctomycetaceae bacterium]|nr:hypothetical protein [Planctomycetaceae bacterium]